ncbi:MAG: phospho-N-acetylmuramoyl-pentapeptide-transferase [Alistipes sp.]|nr:phospho-N-acetylmuramoyl-pentapeptide-transferase [Alistipes sp.]
MFYHLIKYFSQQFDIPGAGMFLSLSFRASMAIILALVIGMIFGRRIIQFLQRKQIGEEVRNLGLEGQLQKRGTPTMGGIIILISILVPILLFGDLTNIYTQLMIISTLWLGLIGFIDDYIKVFRKNKEGLSGRYKIVGQVGLGLIVGCVMWLSPQIVVKEKFVGQTPRPQVEYVTDNGTRSTVYVTPAEKSIKTTIPFVKNNEFDYHWLIPGHGAQSDLWSWLVYVVMATLVITAVSNGANLTDGLDGLASGVSATIVVILGILAYLSGNIIYADYLNIMYIPFSGELVIFAAAFAGALFGFLWYNCYPAQVFMGDTGSLAIGGIIAVFALLIRKELLLPILCGIFFIESLSVILQVGYFKYTKRRYGEGRRIFLMSPLHHHFQKKGHFESKIVVRFWVIQLLLAAITIATLKIR